MSKQSKDLTYLTKKNRIILTTKTKEKDYGPTGDTDTNKLKGHTDY